MSNRKVRLLSKLMFSLGAFAVTNSNAGGISISSFEITYNSSGEQVLKISGAGLKDSGETKLSIGSTVLYSDYSSNTLLVAKCPGNVCRQSSQRIAISTYTLGQKSSLVSSQSWNFDPTNLKAFALPSADIPVPPTFVSGDYGALFCARNVIPTAGACPTGYTALGIAEILFGSAVNCQSDAGGDVPSIQVKPLCRRNDVRP